MQKIKIVTGASYGDEGKGLAADFLASRAEGPVVNVLTNGGPQRGHTVELEDGRRHVFKHFGAGTFRGAGTYFAGQFMVNPMEFVSEYAVLADMHAAPSACADPSCRVTTPWDMLVSQFLAGKNGAHNTCGYGIWETLVRYERSCGLTFGVLAGMTPDERHGYLRSLRDGYFIRRMEELGLHGWLQDNADYAEIFFSDGLARHYEEDLETMLTLCPAGNFPAGCGTVIFENAQGLLLDGNRKEDEEYTTPSTTGSGRVLQTVERRFRGADVEAVYVTRSYLTRHGDGPMENEIGKDMLGSVLPGVSPDLTNGTNPFQGSLRYGLPDERKLAGRIAADFGKTAGAENNRYGCSVLVTHLNERGLDTGLIADAAGCSVYLSDGRTAKDVYRA